VREKQRKNTAQRGIGKKAEGEVMGHPYIASAPRGKTRGEGLVGAAGGTYFPSEGGKGWGREKKRRGKWT